MAAAKLLARWTPQCFSSLISAVSGGQWTQSRRAAVKAWDTTNLCQLCKECVGTVGHRFVCKATRPCGGWPRAPEETGIVTALISPQRNLYMRHRGVLTVKVHTPKRSISGWFEWAKPPTEQDENSSWYMDGSAINPLWRSITTTGFGVVVTNSNGELIGYGRGATPQWVRTAAAAEAWAMHTILAMHPFPPKMVTDCKGLVDTAARGRTRATTAKQPLARIWNIIAAAMDGDLHTLVSDDRIRWVPAHLTEAAIGATLPCGRRFSATDWRASRLADALAKSVAKGNAVPDNVQSLVKAASLASKHACALLGVVTQAANNHEADGVRKDGSACKIRTRDTVAPSKKAQPAAAKAKVTILEPQSDAMEIPDLDWTNSWREKEAEKALVQPRHNLCKAKAAARAQGKKRLACEMDRAEQRVIEEAAADLVQDHHLRPATTRIAALRERVRLREAARCADAEVKPSLSEPVDLVLG